MLTRICAKRLLKDIRSEDDALRKMALYWNRFAMDIIYSGTVAHDNLFKTVAAFQPKRRPYGAR